MQFVLERALVQTTEALRTELVDLTLVTLDYQDSCLARQVIHQVFISWELPPLTFFKVKFDGNVINNRGGVGFIIRRVDSRFEAVGGNHLFGPSIPGAEL